MIAAATSNGEPTATPCLADPTTPILVKSDCTATDTNVALIAPSTHHRQFAALSRDGKHLSIGDVPAGESAVNLDLGQRPPIRITADTRREDWPADVALSIADRNCTPRWNVILHSTVVVALETVSLPEGDYVVEIASDGYRPFSTSLSLHAKAKPAIDLRLVPRVLMSGTIVDERDRGIDGAEILDDAGNLLVRTGADGTFRRYLPDDFAAATLTVTAVGKASRRISMPSPLRDIRLNRFLLRAGWNLDVIVARQEIESDVRLEIIRSSDDGRSNVVTRQRLNADQASATIHGLSSGRYFILLSGNDPLERLVAEVELNSNHTEWVTLPSRNLKGRVLYREKGAPGGHLRVTDPRGLWSSTIDFDEQGEFEVPYWVEGEVDALVTTSAVSKPYTAPGEKPSCLTELCRWDIVIPTRRIVGHVRDAATSLPIFAKIRIRQGAVRSNSFSVRSTNPNGEFVIEPVETGEYEIEAEAEGYAAQSERFLVSETTGDLEFDLLLARNREIEIEIVSANGAPLSNAKVFSIRASGWGIDLYGQVLPAVRSDHEGKLHLSARPGDQKLLFVAPAEGSLAVARLVVPIGDSQAVRVAVPPSVGTVDLTVIEPDGRPARAFLLLRHHGVFVPPDVPPQMSPPVPIHTDASGKVSLQGLPQGVYQIYAWRDRGELAAIVSGVTPTSSLTILVGPGRQEAILRLERATRAQTGTSGF